MSVHSLLSDLRAAGILVSLDGEKVRVDAATGALTPAFREQLTARKAEIVAFLSLAARLKRQQPAIVPLQPRGNRPPMFGVAGHNGDVFAYRALAQHLGEDQPFYGLQPPGYDDSSPPMSRVEELAAYFAAQITAFHPTGSCTVTGFCAGGTIAFELARQLTANGMSVRRLVLFGSPFATWYRTMPQAIAFTTHVIARVRHHAHALKSVGVRGWPRYVTDWIRKMRLRPRPPAPDAVLIRRHAVEVTTMKAVRAYSPGRFAGHVDVMIPAESWAHIPAQLLRWREHAASSTVYWGPDDCTSDTMLRPEHAAAFAALLSESER